MSKRFSQLPAIRSPLRVGGAGFEGKGFKDQCFLGFWLRMRDPCAGSEMFHLLSIRSPWSLGVEDFESKGFKDQFFIWISG